MKQLIVLFSIFLFSTAISAQQISLYNKAGEPIAYIDYDEEATIYLWKGEPVAYLTKERDDICIFGFNGSFLGWYEEGIIYDKKGKKIGVIEDADPFMITKFEPIKGIQKIKPFRSFITDHVPFQPFLSDYIWSSTPLIELLYFGKKN
ncbi:4-fold beta flower protein [Myroides injenensis]|uniref:4-fold beta flower protein n=1 Tax=Myroides injenensis TaxID=1183151 RepID=UPI000288B815|nr:hypothetical protein [Myroides injenensis]